MSEALPDGVSVYDRLVWPEGALERCLATGERRRELIAFLGADEYAALAPLARAAAASASDPTRTVLLVPGIMGSQLGVRRAAPLPDDLLWIDPTDFQQGGLLRLALDHEEVEACGPVVYSYLRLKLELATRGWTVRYFDYDWRHGVLELGDRLAARLADAGGGPTHLVCHSMGGLVARAALARVPALIGRIVTLGTPHAGAYAPLQALRGVYGTVRRLAQLDPTHTAEELATRVFGGFPSLYDMLPRAAQPDWLDAANWPASAPSPRAAELTRAAALRLPDAPERLYCIAGSGQPTVTAARRDGAQMVYRLDTRGDGTVPVDSAALPDHVCRHVALPHSELPRDPDVAAAVAELIEAGATTRLSARETAVLPPMPALEVGDAQLRALFTRKLDWHAMSAEERRGWLDSLNAPLLPLA
jgi:pimeloyl-ACP methyl ester carboxylesterase